MVCGELDGLAVEAAEEPFAEGEFGHRCSARGFFRGWRLWPDEHQNGSERPAFQ